MANVRIADLPAAGALTGAELVPVDQAGVTVKTTAAAILNRPASGFLSVLIAQAGLISSTTTVSAATSIQTPTFIVTSVDDSGSSAQLTANGFGGSAQANGILGGSLQVTKGFAANNATPQTKAAVNAACIDLPTAVALLNQIRAALIANGICV